MPAMAYTHVLIYATEPLACAKMDSNGAVVSLLVVKPDAKYRAAHHFSPSRKQNQSHSTFTAQLRYIHDGWKWILALDIDDHHVKAYGPFLYYSFLQSVTQLYRLKRFIVFILNAESAKRFPCAACVSYFPAYKLESRTSTFSVPAFHLYRVLLQSYRPPDLALNRTPHGPWRRPPRPCCRPQGHSAVTQVAHMSPIPHTAHGPTSAPKRSH